MSWEIRKATLEDVAELDTLIRQSAYELQKDSYSHEQITAAFGSVFGVDEQLIDDGTYFVAVDSDGRIVGCGGWSFRQSPFGGSSERVAPDPELDPASDPARIRAFFVDPDFARQGIGRAIMHICESAVAAAGFTRAEIYSTLVGQQFYKYFGYCSVGHYEIPLEGCPPMPGVRMTKGITGSYFQN